jgi:hypothetical protein
MPTNISRFTNGSLLVSKGINVIKSDNPSKDEISQCH